VPETGFKEFGKAKLLEHIKKWLSERKGQYDETARADATHMIVLADEFGGVSPEFVNVGEDVRTRIAKIEESPVQQILEVYDLTKNLDEQLGEQRAYYL
jgi:hypothetical protein